MTEKVKFMPKAKAATSLLKKDTRCIETPGVYKKKSNYLSNVTRFAVTKLPLRSVIKYTPEDKVEP